MRKTLAANMKNLCQIIVGGIVIALLVLANTHNIVKCLHSTTPSSKIDNHECQTTFLDSEKREKVVVCTASNVTFYIDSSELMVFRDNDADRFVKWLRSCFLKDKTICILERIIHPSSPYCVYNSSFEETVSICSNSIKNPTELRLKDYLFTENQFNRIMEALVFLIAI